MSFSRRARAAAMRAAYARAAAHARAAHARAAAMRARYARIGADKTVVNHIKGMEIVKVVASANVKKGQAEIRLNPAQLQYLEKDRKKLKSYIKEASKFEDLGEAFKYLANTAVMGNSMELTASLYVLWRCGRAVALWRKTGKEYTVEELKNSLLGRQEEVNYKYLDHVYWDLVDVRERLERRMFKVGQLKKG